MTRICCFKIISFQFYVNYGLKRNTSSYEKNKKYQYLLGIKTSQYLIVMSREKIKTLKVKIRLMGTALLPLTYITRHCVNPFRRYCQWPRFQQIRTAHLLRSIEKLNIFFFKCSKQKKVNVFKMFPHISLKKKNVKHVKSEPIPTLFQRESYFTEHRDLEICICYRFIRPTIFSWKL